MSAPVDLGHDELDLMDQPIHPSVFFSASAPVKKQSIQPQELRRSLRPRKSVAKLSATPKSQPRKRAMSTGASSSAPPAQKKLKLDERKANTAVSNEKRDARDLSRNRWLHRHRELFEPLLPSSNTYFQSLSEDKTPFTPLHQLEQQPKYVEAGQMKDYQLQGLSFLVWMYRNGMNCMLGDEMGLGKTLQTLSLFAYIKENVKGPHDPHLVICPLSVLSSWQTEAARWLPSMTTIRFHGQHNERERLKNSLRNPDTPIDILITTYEAFIAEDSWFKSRRWTYCVLDEGHKIKNSDTNVAHKLQGVGSLYRLILTGTPVQNNLLELWGLLHFLYPTVFTDASERQFLNAFDISRGTYHLPFVDAVQKLLSTIMIRRTKAVVEIDVPPKEELTVFIPLTEAQRFWTYRLLTRMDTLALKQVFDQEIEVEDKDAREGRREVLRHVENEILSNSAGGESGKGGDKKTWSKLMNLLMQLRKVCDHPYLLPNAEPSPPTIGEHIVAASSKLIAIDKLLKDLLPKGERVLIFSQWTDMLDLLEEFMHLRSISYARLDGSTTRPRRALDIKLFQREKSPYQVFLISTKAGGLGINLTKASTVIMVDSDWNPQNDLQAIARAHRIGQTKTVKVYRLICRGSVEDQMLDRIRRKLFLSVKLMGSNNSSSVDNSTSLGSNELLDILRKGSSALDNGMDLARFLDAPIAEILEASQSRENARDAKLKQEMKIDSADGVDSGDAEKLLLDAEAEQRQLLSGVAQVQSRLFEGQVIERGKYQKNKDIAEEWQNLQKRNRVSTTYETAVVEGLRFVVKASPPEVVAPRSASTKKTQAKHDWQDHCINCRDGGVLTCCDRCPRVFHPECRVLPHKSSASGSESCDQHACWDCLRGTQDAGGMLFRCQTCPRAFCEDCMPEDIDPIGDILPEFALLHCKWVPTAYFIRCVHCHEYAKENPAWWKEWQKDIVHAENELKRINLLAEQE